MAQTNLMRADEIAHSFNSAAEPKYWKASVAGSRVNPEVHFNSRSSMVRVTYRIASNDFTVSFSRTAVAFGDFMASVYRSLEQVMTRLVAAGLPFTMPVEDSAVLRLEYNPGTKATVVHLAHCGASWFDAEPMVFKVPERNSADNSLSPIDGL
jgi:hypothetical protein